MPLVGFLLLNSLAAWAQTTPVVFQSSFEASPFSALSVEGPSTVVRDTSAQLRALAVLRTGVSIDVTAAVQWSSSEPNVGRIDDRGRVETGNVGMTIITATLPGHPGVNASRELATRLPGIVRQWTFNEEGGGNSTLADRVGNQSALIVNRGGNDAVASGGVVTMAGGSRGFSDYVSLPWESLAGLEDATIEIWGLSNAPRAWSRVFDFGTSTSNYLFVSWSRFADPSQTRVEWMKDGVPLFTADNEIGPFPLGVEQQVVVTINQIGENESTVCWYQNGGLEGCRTIAATLADITPTQPGVAFNALGRSKYEADETATAVYNEARIWDGALSANGVNATFLNGPVGGGVDIDISVVPATSVAVGTTTQMRATVTSTGGPITQDVDWQVTPQTVARIDSGGLLTGTQAGEVTVTATLRNRPTSAGSVTVSVQPAANPTAGFRVTAADLIGDLNKLPRSYQVRSWDGMDWPSAASSRGNDGHLQGVARVGETWVLTHSRGSFDGVIIWGENNAWQFDAARADLGRHPGGIQASADVIAVTYKDQANGIKFYRFDPDDPSAAFEELSHLRISSARGEAVGLAWHPDHGRYYLLDAGTFDNAVTSNKFCRTTKLGAPLSDPQNRWECGAQATSVFASSSGTQLMFDEDTRNLYAIALYRPGEDIPTEDLVDMVEDVVTDPDNMISFHQIQVTRLDFGSYDPSGPFADVRGFDAGGRGDFFPQPGLYIHQPSFRWASGVLLDESGHVSLIAVERCTSFESEFPGDSNQLPCEFFQDEVDYFIIE